MITPLGWLERVPTYKSSSRTSQSKDLSTYGLSRLSRSSAADILIYKQVSFQSVRTKSLMSSSPADRRRFNHLYPPKRQHRHPARTAAAAHAYAKAAGTDGRRCPSHMTIHLGSAILNRWSDQKAKNHGHRPRARATHDPGNPDVCPVGDLHKIFSDKQTLEKVYAGCRSAG